jgi:two-component system, NtrC family, sensor histidine kinase KinB
MEGIVMPAKAHADKPLTISMERLWSISRELAAQLNLHTLVERILQRTLEAVGATSGSLLVLDDEGQVSEGALAYGGTIHEHTWQQLMDTYERGLAGWVVEHRQPVIIPNTRLDQRWLQRREAEGDVESNSAACVPLLARDRVAGVLTLGHPEEDHFHPEDLAFLRVIGDQAGIALENAQLFEATQEARQRYAALFEDNVDPILISDLEGTVTDANHRAETFLGYDREDLRGRSMFSLHVPDAERLPGDLSQIVSGSPIAYEGRVTHADGHPVPVQVHVTRVGISGQPLLQWIVRDITERQALDELRADLTAMVFHDLRSPLGNVISSLEVLQASIPPQDEALQSVLAISLRSSRRLSRLVESLLDVGQLESGKAVLHKAQGSINSIIADAVEEIHPVAEAKGQVLHFTLAPADLPMIEMDVDMIRRVLINLLENAVKFTRGGGQISVSATPGSGEVCVVVRDTGPGIAPREQQRIFDKFTRLHQEGNSKGLGLGLAFCRLAVEAHGGRIWVESVPGQGATFSFTLPL